MQESPYGHRMTPLQIAGIYCVFGVAWIVLSDYLAFSFVASPAARSQLHAVKGSAFVAVSGLLIYGLTRYNRHELAAATADLEDRVQQAHVLHRILRHNLRNKCNIIAGHAEALRADGAGKAAATIERQTAEMVDLSEKSNLLRKIALEESQPVAVDLVPLVDGVVADVREMHPEPTIRVDRPATARVYAHPEIDQAIRELVVNAVKHGDPPVTVGVVTEGTTDTVVRVADRGEGLPEVERTVLEEGFRETQTYHSKGLGLWVVRYLMRESDGTATAKPTDGEGAIVRLRFRPTSAAALDRFLR